MEGGIRMTDESLKRVKSLEVMESILDDLARLTFSHYDSMQNAGFERNEALMLAIQWHELYIRRILQDIT